MEWYFTIALLLGGLVVVMLLGMPVAFSFMLINFIGIFLFWGGISGFDRLLSSMARSIGIFTLIPIPLFIMLGLIMYHSGMTPAMIEALDKWIGRLPGRLSLLSVAAGTILGALCGDSMASVSVIGTVMYPEMERRKYHHSISLGSILSTGRLALMIPPSTLAVVLGGLARISIGKLLIGILIPGLMLAVLYGGYIYVRCKTRPTLAPPYEVPKLSLAEKAIPFLRDVIPLSLIVFLVTGVIFMGIATPSEAAATGAFGAIVLSAVYRKLSWKMMKNTLVSTLEITIMIYMIIASAVAFSTNLAVTGASRGLVDYVTGLPLSPLLIVVAMNVIILILGLFMECVAMMMITIPLFMPVVTVLSIDPIWWAVVMLLSIAIGPITPPFGLDMFALKGVLPQIAMRDIYNSAIPYVVMSLIVLVIILVVPTLTTWLPSMMHY